MRSSPQQDKPKARGSASTQQPDLKDRGGSYLNHHFETAKVSWQRLMATPLATLMTLMMIAIALSLPGVLYVGLQNVEQLGQRWQGSAQLSVFLADALSEAEGRDLAQQLSDNSQFSQLSYLSKDEALAEFKAYAGFGNALELLKENPLPAVILITPSTDYLLSDDLSNLTQQLLSLDGVDDVRVDMDWVQRLQAMVTLGQRTVLLLGLLLALGVVLVVGNTIRLEIQNRRDEIIVVKLVGGTDSFVRRPFLYTGFWYGIGAGLVAWLLVQLSLWYLGTVVDRLIQLYHSEFQLQGLGLGATLLLMLIAVTLGSGGAWLAVLRHLRAIEPR
ncbi:cell division protein FtsX [Motiliproteus coralliicola]|uniref:Cell division protein FtsX n=1 Tax=Motiliproteus coralliicola TaxID=2283196 RepID=A0A369WAF1_9GAMM|nr:permease-like cell division protein FtsX [Motiliproteus coralliicola]RDE18988.1 cell division protein FtsX [Motiliproteus coralliicola]